METSSTRAEGPLNGLQNPRFWSGELTEENAENIAETFRTMFARGEHTVASVRDGVLCQIYTSNRLRIISARPGAIDISNTSGLWFVNAPAAFRFDGDKVFITHKSGAGVELQWAFASQRE